MLENDLRKQAKVTATHITPEKLRRFIADKIGEVETVFDLSVGSGQLLQYVKANKFIGNDIDSVSIEYFERNFENTESYIGNYFDLPKLDYNVAVANYPFSLNSKGIINYDKNKWLIDIFFKNGNITGKADWLFIIKTLLEAKDKTGYYIAFPGILYRNNEQKFRDYLINQKLLKSYGIIKNCKFDATNIDVVYLELKLNTKNLVETFLYDLETQTYLKKENQNLSELLGKDWAVPRVEFIEEEINIEELEQRIAVTQAKRRLLEDKLDDFIKSELKDEQKVEQGTVLDFIGRSN